MVIRVGVRQALKSHRRISFADIQPPATTIDMGSSHIVVCEDGDLHAQVIAAAYALSLDAGVCRLAFPDVPSTHLFRHPDLGIAIISGIAAEQEAAPGVRASVVISPHSNASGDAQTALLRLTDAGVLSKALRGEIATVHQAAKTITLFPYDLLLIATHCTDAPGYRCTYEFTDTDGRNRCLVLDETAGAEIEPHDADRVHVAVFESFVSLDGVDWGDRYFRSSCISRFRSRPPLQTRRRGHLDDSRAVE